MVSDARRIVAIDDSSEFLDLVRELFADSSHAVDCHLGDDVDLEQLARMRPDLTILDLRLKPIASQLSGWEFLVLIRSHAELRRVPVIVCSADLRELDRRRAELQSLAVTWVLPKPFELAGLERMVSRALDHVEKRASQA